MATCPLGQCDGSGRLTIEIPHVRDVTHGGYTYRVPCQCRVAALEERLRVLVDRLYDRDVLNWDDYGLLRKPAPPAAEQARCNHERTIRGEIGAPHVCADCGVLVPSAIP